MNTVKWVDINDEMPAVGRRVVCELYAETENPYWAGGYFDGECWIVDEIYRPLDRERVQFWAPVAKMPRREQ